MLQEEFQERVNKVHSIIRSVCDGAKASWINRNQCNLLAELYEQIGAFVKQLMMMDAVDVVLSLQSLDEFIHLLEKGKVLVLQYSSAQWFELLVTRGDNREAFKEVHCALDLYITTLQMEVLQIATEVHLPSLFDKKLSEDVYEDNARKDRAQMLEKLEELEKNVPIAIKKLKHEHPFSFWDVKGKQSKEELPFIMQIDPLDIEVGKQIGKGAYGLVHEAYWLGCKFAIKIIETSDVSQLQKEVGILSKLRHPHIVQLVGFSVTDGRSMIVMERMDDDLRHLIEVQCDSPPFSQHVAIDIISQIAAGMAYLHNQGVFHGDLKASNVLVNRHGDHIEAKITDFGVSQSVQLIRRCESSRFDKNGDVSPNSSKSDVYSASSFSGIVGTTCWRAPEVFPVQSAKHIVEGKAEMTEAEKVIMDGHSVLEPLITKRPRYKRYKRTMKHADVEQKLGGDSDISTEHATDIVGGLGGDSILDKISRELQKSRRGEVITHNIMNNNGVKLVANKPTLEPTYTAKADVYSFGMTCYEVLTGCTPFSSLPRSAVYKRVIAGERPELPADIDTRLYNLIQMCWDTDAQKRPTFKEIRSSLEDIMMPPISQLHSQAPRLNGQCTIS